MYKCILILFVIMQCGSAYADTVTASDGTVLQFAPQLEAAPKVKRLKPGETYRSGEEKSVMKGWLKQETIYSWEETYNATKNGIEQTVGGSKTVRSVRPEKIFALIGLGCMGLAGLIVLLFGLTFFAFAATFAAATFAVAFATFATALATAFAALALAFAAFAAAVATTPECTSKKWFYIFASMHIVLMGGLLFAA